MDPVVRTQRLKQISESVKQGNDESYSVREIISWFNAERRGYLVSSEIRRELERQGLVTQPDFEGVHIDYRIRFQQKPPQEQDSVDIGALPPQEGGANDKQQEVVPEDSLQTLISGASSEPAFRVSRLHSSGQGPLSVKPDCLLKEAVTLMLRHDYSQLPVMTTLRDVKGIISWSSIAPKLLFCETPPKQVRECMKQHIEVSSKESLFSVIEKIIQHSAVLVRGENREITGIITKADLILHFQQLSEPFLLLAEIENHIRVLIDGKFTVDELNGVKNQADTAREIHSVADLTFGEYIRLLENSQYWKKSSLLVDRSVYVKELSDIRKIRNDVMHFDPDGISEDDHRRLLTFVRFLHELRTF